MPDPYLVLFVADPADDGHADALRAAARAVPQAGFFDDPAGGDTRTVGVYLRTEDLADGLALVAAVGMRRFGLGYGPRPRRRWYLGEQP